MNIINWFITSSQDPQKTSLFVKGFLSTLSLLAISAGVDAEQWVLFSAGATDLIFFALSAVSALVTFYGLARKIIIGRWSSY